MLSAAEFCLKAFICSLSLKRRRHSGYALVGGHRRCAKSRPRGGPHNSLLTRNRRQENHRGNNKQPKRPRDPAKLAFDVFQQAIGDKPKENPDAGKNPAAVALGKLGGSAKSKAKAKASRANGKLGGRPRKQSPKKEITPPHKTSKPFPRHSGL